MRSLNNQEYAACQFLNMHGGSYCPGEGVYTGGSGYLIKSIFDGLVKKKRATGEMTDDGPRYHLTPQGQVDAT